MARPTSRRSLRFDNLEDRQLLSSGGPSSQQQYMLQLINMVRSTPKEAAEWVGNSVTRELQYTLDHYKVDLEGVKRTIASNNPLPPVAWNDKLGDAAQEHSQDMANNRFQSHTGSDGSSPEDRIKARGFQAKSAAENAFIRPSPAAGTLGGVAAKTREAMLLCEAAGFDVVLAETVGIGQSETAVCDMTDFFLALMLPGAGDELQGIKKGLVELADMIAINKADGDNLARANAAAAEYRAALHILAPRSEHWFPPVLTYSALTGAGLESLWRKVCDHRAAMDASGEFMSRRRAQQVKWMWAILEENWRARLRANAGIRAKVRQIEAAVANGTLAPALAAEQLTDLVI